MPDFIPRTDAEFETWLHNFMTYVAAHAAEIGLLPADSANLNDLYLEWPLARQNIQTAQTSLQVAIQHKNTVREGLEQTARGMVRRVQAYPNMTDEHRRGLRITIKDDTSTIPMAPPVSRPMFSIDTSQRLQHTLRFFDENTQHSRARPAGVKGCEIWGKIGTAPTDPCECQFVALDTASPYLAEYAGADAGKVAYYMLRWVSISDEKGPWSEVIGATIVG